MSKSVNPVPLGFHTVTPYLICKGAAAAIDFYQRAFGASTGFRLNGPGGSVAHAEIQIGESRIMLADESPQMGNRSPQSLGGSPVTLHLYVDDVDAWFERAVAAGAKVKRPVQDQFYGDRSGSVEDPFGHGWHLATHIEDLTPAEIEQRAAKLFGG